MRDIRWCFAAVCAWCLLHCASVLDPCWREPVHLPLPLHRHVHIVADVWSARFPRTLSSYAVLVREVFKTPTHEASARFPRTLSSYARCSKHQPMRRVPAFLVREVFKTPTHEASASCSSVERVQNELAVYIRPSQVHSDW